MLWPVNPVMLRLGHSFGLDKLPTASSIGLGLASVLLTWPRKMIVLFNAK